MEKIIFFGLVIPILGFVLYLGGSAIMNGFSAKSSNKLSEGAEEEENNEVDFKNIDNNTNNLSNELNKLNELLEKGVLTQEEFDKAKKKILDN